MVLPAPGSARTTRLGCLWRLARMLGTNASTGRTCTVAFKRKLEDIFEERVSKALAKLGVPTAKSVEALVARIEALEKARAVKAAPAAKKAAAAKKSPAKKAAARKTK